jgi:hypothetical protein
MQNILDTLFRSEMTYSAAIQAKTATFVDGVQGSVSWVTSKTASCIIWRGGASDRSINDRIRAEIDAVALFKPYDVSESDFSDTSRLDITGYGVFSIVKAVNIAGQDSVIQVYLKEFK